MNTPIKVPFEFTAEYVPAYFQTGMYKVEIFKVALNKHGEPVITLRVLDSPHGKMINARKTMNFFLTSSSVKASQLWRAKLTDLLKSLNMDKITDLSVLLNKRLVMAITNAGRDTLPNFRPEKDFDPTWQPKESSNTQWRVKAQDTSRLTKVLEQEPPIDIDDDIPF